MCSAVPLPSFVTQPVGPTRTNLGWRGVFALMHLVMYGACALAMTACPQQQHPGTADAPRNDANSPNDARPPQCEAPVASCMYTFRFTGNAQNVSLRGDFAANGWETGVTMTRTANGSFEAAVPISDDQIILYKFVVDGTWQADPANPRRSPDGFGGTNSVVRADCDACPRFSAGDWRDAVMYFVLIDRFYDGNPGNNAPVANVDFAGNYQGGDLAGLKAKIESGYFNDLGVTSLWLSSPIDNADNANPGVDGHTYSGYHGYWPAQLDHVESKIGSEAELKAVVAAAHARGLTVLVDYVMNHVHATSPTYTSHRDWFWPNDNGAGGDCVCGRGCDWGAQRLRCWFDPFLPDFNFNNAEARRFSVDNAIAWAKRLGIDGFRLDAVKHIETSWLTDLRARANAELVDGSRFYMVGETFEGDRGLIASYVNPDTMLDGQFDFPLRAQLLRNVLRREGTMQELANFLGSNDAFYGANAVMSTFIGNHDVPRVVHIAEDAPLFGEWDGGKHRAWNNQPQLPTLTSAFERLALAYAVLYTSPGIPMLYYGDEVGMAGGGDPDNRRMMQWDNYTPAQLALRQQLAAFAKARAAHPALRRGTRTTLFVDANLYTYQMSTGPDTVVVTMNRSDVTQTAPGLVTGRYRDALTGETLTTPIALPPRSVRLLVVP